MEYTISTSTSFTHEHGYRPQVKVNGVYIYHTERNAKTKRGAQAKADRMAISIESSLVACGNRVQIFYGD